MRENRQLAGKITELEKVLAELERQKSRAEQELPRVREEAEDALRRQRRDAADIALQKVRAESEAQRYRRELQAVERDLRGFREQLAEHSAAQRALEERLTRKDCSLQELERQRGELMAELRRKKAHEAELLELMERMEKDLTFRKQAAEKQLVGKQKIDSEARRTVTEMQHPCRESAHPACPNAEAKDLKEQVDELMAANRRAEQDVRKLKCELGALQLEKTSSEEKARLLKEKLDETNKSLRCLKLELERKDQAEEGYSRQLQELGRQLSQTTGRAAEVRQEAADLTRMKHSYELEL